jgi:hypothetical protein
MLLDQLLLLHQHQRQIADAVLLRDFDFGHLGTRRKRRKRERAGKSGPCEARG